MGIKGYPANPPNDPHWSYAPRSDWQQQVRNQLLPLLSSHGWQKRLAYLYYFYRVMVQVAVDNWTLHFEVSTGGDDFKESEARLGDLTGKAFITFDVEGARKGINKLDKKALLDLKKEVHAALISNNIYEKLGLENHPVDHHLVWEAIDAEDTPLAARRIIEYMDAIYDIAYPILVRLETSD